MITVFGDESHDGQKQLVFAVAGVGTWEEDWKAFEPIWLSRENGRLFHSSDCEADKEDFSITSHEENLALYKDMVDLVVNSNIVGQAAVMDLATYKEFFPDVVDNLEYQFCFSYVMQYFFDISRESQQEIEFVFDRTTENDYAAGLLYSYMSELPEEKQTRDSINALRFDKRSKYVGLRVADLIAREAMKHALNVELGSKPPRKSMLALLETNRFYFQWFGRKYFQWWIDNMDDYIKKSKITEAEYEQWLNEMKLDDNASARNRFMIYSLKKERGQ